MENNVILSVRDLDVKFTLRGQTLHAVRGATLDVYAGESLAIVGESGSGKSVFVKTFMGLLDSNGFISGGQILYNGADLTKFRTDKEWLKIRGREIAMVLQDPMTSLNPLKTIGKQIEEAVRLHQGLRGKQARQAVLEVLSDVGIDEPERRARQYPHEFSGGMRQRVVIAIALACRPKILVCDEPTTALDVTIQAQILELMQSLQKKLGMAIIMITHDLGVIAGMCDEVIVMYAGSVCERGTADNIFYRPRHEYTRGLLRSIPNIDTDEKERLVPISGTPIDLLRMPPGCAFAPRCERAMKLCLEGRAPEMFVGEDHIAACWLNVKEAADRNIAPRSGEGEIAWIDLDGGADA